MVLSPRSAFGLAAIRVGREREPWQCDREKAPKNATDLRSDLAPIRQCEIYRPPGGQSLRDSVQLGLTQAHPDLLPGDVAPVDARIHLGTLLIGECLQPSAAPKGGRKSSPPSD